MLIAFDLIELDGEDLRRTPIEQRKRTLAKLVRRPHATTDIEEESLEEDIVRNIREMKSTGAALVHPANAKDEVSSDNLGRLLRRVARLATSDKATIVIEKQPDGKMRITSGSWEGEKVFLKDQVLEVRHAVPDGRGACGSQNQGAGQVGPAAAGLRSVWPRHIERRVH